MNRGGVDFIDNEIASLSRRWHLLPLHRVLLGHDGSMTRLLQLVTQARVGLSTVRQCVVPCPKPAADLLGIEAGEPSNEREIVIARLSDGYPLLYAKSYTPLSRLRPSFKEDLMRADMPIGRILQKYRIEARREILEVGCKEQDPEIQGFLRAPGPYLWRTYNIITQRYPLITITESFSAPFFAQAVREAVKTLAL